MPTARARRRRRRARRRAIARHREDPHRLERGHDQRHTTARILESAGITRLAVHGRTKEQGYSGRANWDVIAEVAESVKIP